MTDANSPSGDHASADSGLATKHRARWSKEEDDFLRANYTTLDAKRIGERLGRSEGSVHYRVRKLKGESLWILPWTTKEYDFLEEHYETSGPKYVSEQLGRSENAIYNRAHALGLKPPPEMPKAAGAPKMPHEALWSKSDDEILRDYYQSLPARVLGEILGRSERSVRGRARYLGLRKYKKRRAH